MPDDTRARVAHGNKQVNLAQLDAELGNHGLCASDDEIVVAEGSPVTKQQLAAALKAHIADDDYGLDDDVKTVRGFLANASPTSAQTATALKAFLRSTGRV